MQIIPVNYNNQSRNRSFGRWKDAQEYGEQLLREGKITKVDMDRAMDRILDSEFKSNQRPRANTAEKSSNTTINSQA